MERPPLSAASARPRPARAAARAAATMVVAALVSTTLAGEATAANSDEFNPGRIISDEVFFDPSSMTVAQIATFISSRGAACVSGSVPCLKDFVETTKDRAAEPGLCASMVGAPNETAAQIIYKTAVACGINPRVLLVTLEKEQGLVTARTPTTRKYQIAMGFGCPDSAPCDEQYYGFSNQVFLAARQFLKYRLYPTRYNVQAGQTESIAYHPSSSCGSSSVLVQNQATAGLYNYTPYQPNAAALKNLYGLGDSCSSYGNRNFWRLYTDWFGSTELQGARRVPQRDFNRDALPDYFAAASTGILYGYYAKPNSADIGRLKYGRGWLGMRHVTTSYDLLRNSETDVVAVTADGNLMVYPIATNGAAGAPVQLGRGWTAFDEVFGGDDWGPSHSAVLFARLASTGELLAYESTGAVGFKAAVSLGTGWEQYDLMTFAHDFDGDGRVDLIARGKADQNLYLFPGTYEGNFGEPELIGYRWGAVTEIIAAGDWNQDGVLDFLGVTTAGSLWRYTGKGDGTIGSSMQVGKGWATFTPFP